VVGDWKHLLVPMPPRNGQVVPVMKKATDLGERIGDFEVRALRRKAVLLNASSLKRGHGGWAGLSPRGAICPMPWEFHRKGVLKHLWLVVVPIVGPTCPHVTSSEWLGVYFIRRPSDEN